MMFACAVYSESGLSYDSPDRNSSFQNKYGIDADPQKLFGLEEAVWETSEHDARRRNRPTSHPKDDE